MTKHVNARCEEVVGHPTTTYHRVDVFGSSWYLRVCVNGEIAADTRRPKPLFETSLPVRRYIPPRLARADLLVPSETQTLCPCKGVASCWPMQTKNSEMVELEVDG